MSAVSFLFLLLLLRLRIVHVLYLDRLYDCRSENPSAHYLPCHPDFASTEARPPLKFPAVISPRFQEYKLVAQPLRLNLFQGHYDAYNQTALDLDSSIHLPSQYDSTPHLVWTFNGKFPGPVIYAEKDTQIVIHLTNLLQVSIGFALREIWHDDDTLYEVVIRPGKSKKIELKLEQSGTFVFHCPLTTPNYPEAMGLYGVIITKDAAFAGVQDRVLFVNGDVILDPEKGTYSILKSPADVVADTFNGVRGNVILVNGRSMSVGYAVPLMTQAIYRFHVVNTGLSSTLEFEFPLSVQVMHQWTEATHQPSRTGLTLAPGTAASVLLQPLTLAGDLKKPFLTVKYATRGSELRAAVPRRPLPQTRHGESQLLMYKNFVYSATEQIVHYIVLAEASNEVANVATDSGFELVSPFTAASGTSSLKLSNLKFQLKGILAFDSSYVVEAYLYFGVLCSTAVAQTMTFEIKAGTSPKITVKTTVPGCSTRNFTFVYARIETLLAPDLNFGEMEEPLGFEVTTVNVGSTSPNFQVWMTTDKTQNFIPPLLKVAFLVPITPSPVEPPSVIPEMFGRPILQRFAQILDAERVRLGDKMDRPQHQRIRGSSVQTPEPLQSLAFKYEEWVDEKHLNPRLQDKYFGQHSAFQQSSLESEYQQLIKKYIEICLEMKGLDQVLNGQTVDHVYEFVPLSREQEETYNALFRSKQILVYFDVVTSPDADPKATSIWVRSSIRAPPGTLHQKMQSKLLDLRTDWDDTTIITINVNVANVSDAFGHVAMWMIPSVNQTKPVTPGEAIVWFIRNRTMKPITLLFDSVTIQAVVIRCLGPDFETTLQHVYPQKQVELTGVTIPPDEAGGRCTLFAYSIVPGFLKKNLPKGVYKWSIFIQEAHHQLSHNGLHTKIDLELFLSSSPPFSKSKTFPKLSKMQIASYHPVHLILLGIVASAFVVLVFLSYKFRSTASYGSTPKHDPNEPYLAFKTPESVLTNKDRGEPLKQRPIPSHMF